MTGRTPFEYVRRLRLAKSALSLRDELPASRYLQFSGEPFAEEDYEIAISEIWEAIAKYNPASVGYAWDEYSPRIQLEPRGERGYIELVAVSQV